MKTFKICGYVTILFSSLLACQDTNLEDFNLRDGNGVQVAASSIAGTVTKTNESLTIPVSLQLSANAAKAFEVRLRVNQDTVEKLIEAGQLTDVSAIPAGAILIDNVASVKYGSDETQFNITVARTAVEQYFGKTVVIAYSIDDAGKGNNIDPAKSTGFITLNTVDLLAVEDLHYISFQTGGNIVQVKDRQNYVSSSGGISIPLVVDLASFPSSSFAVDIIADADTIASMVTHGSLPANTVALTANQFTMPPKLTFPSNTSQAGFALDIPWSVINSNLGKQVAIVVRLTNPTLHIINPEKRFTTLLVDCNNVLEEDVTNLGVFSVSRDNNNPTGNEGSVKMVDNNVNSKFLQSDFIGDLVCKLVFAQPQKIGAYTLTSGDDDQRRDPKEWNLQGSNDGVTWTTIDSRANETFSGRKMTKRFNVAFPTTYTQYRLNIMAIVGGTNLFQISEWRMIKVL